MHELDQIKAPVASYVDDFHSQFASILATKSEWLKEAIEHLSASTGKQVRPILTALIAGLLHGDVPPQRSIDAAVLLELIHTATLIHDDVIDEAKTRRGRPTLGVLFDNRVAVLMGDFILSSALVGAIALSDLRIMGIVSAIGRELTEGEIRQFETAEGVTPAATTPPRHKAPFAGHTRRLQEPGVCGGEEYMEGLKAPSQSIRADLQARYEYRPE